MDGANKACWPIINTEFPHNVFNENATPHDPTNPEDRGIPLRGRWRGGIGLGPAWRALRGRALLPQRGSRRAPGAAGRATRAGRAPGPGGGTPAGPAAGLAGLHPMWAHGFTAPKAAGWLALAWPVRRSATLSPPARSPSAARHLAASRRRGRGRRRSSGESGGGVRAVRRLWRRRTPSGWWWRRWRRWTAASSLFARRRQ